MHHILNRRADTHATFCEDAYYYAERDGWVIAAVFDGCSQGVNSHFAAQMHAYSFRKIIDMEFRSIMQMHTAGRLTMDNIVDAISSVVTTQILATAEAMALTGLENLSTIVFCLYNIKSKYLIVKFLGDGMVHVNGESHRVASGPDNAPNYVGYMEIDECDVEVFSNLYPTKVFSQVKSFSICTDGIDSVHHAHRPLEECIHYLLEDDSLMSSQSMLSRKMNVLHKQGMQLGDDLTIIRYTNETV